MYIGAENIISPLGYTAKDNFAALLQDKTGLKVVLKNNIPFCLSLCEQFTMPSKFYSLLANCFQRLTDEVDPDIIVSNKTIVIVSTTKGNINPLSKDSIEAPILRLKKEFGLVHQPIIVSNACISGVLAMIMASNLIHSGAYHHAFVIGADVVSDFVLSGFQCLFALSEVPCRPFDISRKGINLGEGAGGVVLSKEKNIYKEIPIKFLGGTTANDANHISGPSRTGEGLFRTITRTLKKAKIGGNDIDFISAHGTATKYNDDMESIAFDRLNLTAISTNSLKGYFGHTLGAAGLIETAICLQSMRQNALIKSRGYATSRTVKPLNILENHITKPVNIVMKTASGFGGCNASIILCK